MSIYKEDIAETKNRMSAWWDHEIIDHPCIHYVSPKPGKRIPFNVDYVEYIDPWYLAEHWDDFEKCLDNFENTCTYLYFGGESIPRFWPNYGPGVLAAILGINPRFMSRTMWFERTTTLEEIIPLLENAELNLNNPWYARLLKVTEIAARRAGKNYCVAFTDIGAPLDILAYFLPPAKLIVTMKRRPELIDRCRSIILEKILKLYNDLQTIIEWYGEGCNTWMDIWCPKRWYPIQCDFSAMLSPDWFRRFALPDIITQAESLDYAIYHLDGPAELKYLEDLLKVEAIDGIQWVPGAGKPLASDETWLPLYKKIQSARKSVVLLLFETPERLAHLYTALDPKLLYITSFFDDYCRSQFFIPKFAGGQAGEGDMRGFIKNCREKMKSLRQTSFNSTK